MSFLNQKDAASSFLNGATLENNFGNVVMIENNTYNGKYINSKPAQVSTRDLRLMVELEQYQVTFCDDEIFAYKIGTIPGGNFSLIHEKTKNQEQLLNVPYVSFYLENAAGILDRLSHIYKTINPGNPTYGLKFNKNHKFIKRVIPPDEMVSKIDCILKHKLSKLQKCKAKNGGNTPAFHQSFNAILSECNDLNELKSDIIQAPENYSFLESNYFKFQMLNYVYLKFLNGQGFRQKRFNLCNKQPNAILLNNHFKDSLNRRSDKKTDKLLKEYSTIQSHDLFSFDIFYKKNI